MKATIEQIDFTESVKINGGIGLIVYSIDEVLKILN